MLTKKSAKWGKIVGFEIELRPRGWLVLRLIIALLFGSALVFFTLLAARERFQVANVTEVQRATQLTLKRDDAAIEAYRQDHHTLPKSLDDLPEGYDETDIWGHPFIFTVHGDSYMLMSYGQDGKPGGTGWDADITPFDLHSVRSVPTYRQFLTSSVTREAVRAALITGILAGPLCFVTMQPRPATRRAMAGLIPRVGIVLAAAIVVGMFMTALHLPSGH